MARLTPFVDPKRSSIYVFAALEPQELALFDAQEIRVSPSDAAGARVEVKGHEIGYWHAGCARRTAAREVTRGERVLRLTLALYALLGGHPFRLVVQHWLETQGVVGYRTMMGFRNPRFGHVTLLDPDHARNRILREAVELAGVVDAGTVAHRIALFDLHAALLEPSPDAILYAYRAVEGVRQAITPSPASDETWRAMHDRLGTDEAALKRLGKVAQAVRHADTEGEDAAAARGGSARLELLDNAQDTVFREVSKLVGRDLLMFAPED